ncbi:uncharacterized protein isoform X3 [Choristoneura fumiferana]|uniref:uncharacterized protein isoform X3 n=2 Tax=Choristoneura fumiferana TaxID=7141 RepID=UPI003D156157
MSFPKKLLVAISVVLIITMCLPQTEALSLEHKQRHKKHHNKENMPTQRITKDASHIRRPKNVDLHSMLARKIIKKLKNTRRFFTDARKEISDSRENRFGNPRWLPKVNFIEIHNHVYDDLPKGKPMSAQKFAYVVPKLYKTLLDYKAVWERLHIVNIRHLDNDFLMNYTRKRDSLIRTTLAELQKFITEVEDDMEKANVAKPHVNKNRMNLEHLQIDDVDTNRCLRQDTIAIRAYANTLKKWYWELRCPDDSFSTQCKKSARQLLSKKNGKQVNNPKRAMRQRRHRQLRLEQQIE